MGGISATTANNLLYGTDGYVTVNSVDVGATQGDIVIEMSTDEYYPDLMQARLPLVGTGKIIGAAGKITVTLVEWAYAVLATLYSMGSSSDANSEQIGSGALGTITELTNVVVQGVTKNNAKAFKATMAAARVTSPLSATLSETQNTGLEVVFEALGTTSAPSTMPMWIQIAV
jgi:hypothetical protein